jgi:hypothetical protein
MKAITWPVELQTEIRRCFDYNPDTGVVRRIVATSGRFGKPGPVVSMKTSGYLQAGLTVNGRFYNMLVHRIAYFLHTGEMPDEVDHRDTNKTNNRANNLRAASRSLNVFNQGVKRGTIYKHLPYGVVATRNRGALRYKAQIEKDGARYEWTSIYLAAVVSWRRGMEIKLYGEHPSTR